MLNKPYPWFSMYDSAPSPYVNTQYSVVELAGELGLSCVESEVQRLPEEIFVVLETVVSKTSISAHQYRTNLRHMFLIFRRNWVPIVRTPAAEFVPGTADRSIDCIGFLASLVIFAFSIALFEIVVISLSALHTNVNKEHEVL